MSVYPFGETVSRVLIVIAALAAAAAMAAILFSRGS